MIYLKLHLYCSVTHLFTTSLAKKVTGIAKSFARYSRHPRRNKHTNLFGGNKRFAGLVDLRHVEIIRVTERHGVASQKIISP